MNSLRVLGIGLIDDTVIDRHALPSVLTADAATVRTCLSVLSCIADLSSSHSQAQIDLKRNMSSTSAQEHAEGAASKVSDAAKEVGTAASEMGSSAASSAKESTADARQSAADAIAPEKEKTGIEGAIQSASDAVSGMMGGDGKEGK